MKPHPRRPRVGPRFPRVWLLLLALTAASASASSVQIPDVIRDPNQPQIAPIWVSASAALDSTGKLRNDYLWQVQYQWDQMSERGQIAKEGCLAQGPVYVDPLPHQVPVKSLAKLADFSLAIVKGTIADSEPGFYLWSAGVLLRLEPVEVISGEITANDAPLFLYYPTAKFSIGSYSFCKVDPRASYEPSPGDQILAFVRTGATGPERRLIGPMPEDIFVQTKAGDLLVPEDLRDDPRVAESQSLADIVAAISKEKRDEG